LKKTIAIFLILLFAINLFGGVLLFLIQKSEIQNEFRQYLKHSVSVNNLTLIKITKNNKSNNSLIFTKRDEFRYKGSMYDIVKKKVTKEAIYYYCFNDKKEENLRKNFVNNFKRSEEGSNSSKRNFLILEKLLTIGFLDRKDKFENVIKDKQTTVFITSHHISFITDTSSPPPESII
jgi:hypothetical protein